TSAWPLAPAQPHETWNCGARTHACNAGTPAGARSVTSIRPSSAYPTEARMNILIAEPLAPAGIELLQSQAGWNVVVSNPKEFAAHLATADALLVRSAVQVD